MVELAKKSNNLNSLWSIIYCFLVIGGQVYIIYLSLHNLKDQLNQTESLEGGSPGILFAEIGLIILAVITFPLFILTSVVKCGNYANDGTKLGRDHALDPNINCCVKKIKKKWFKHLWQDFCPFSQTLHILSAFCLLIADPLIEAAMIYHGQIPTEEVWSSPLDFVFPPERIWQSHGTLQGWTNQTYNATTNVLGTPTLEITSTSLGFVNLVLALFAFCIRYASVFWYTNKILSGIFALQLLFMAFNAIFSYAGMSLLYKLGSNQELFYMDLGLQLNPYVTLSLFIIGGIILIASSIIFFEYSSMYFQEKFMILNKKHNPEQYARETVIYHMNCRGYVPHSCAMAALMLIACCKGPMIYDLISVYQVTDDQLAFTSVILDVTYMVFWITLWMFLTIKQQWLFRILDFIPLQGPVFTVSDVVQSAAFRAGSIELQEKKKRPGSIPSVELTPSESGFDDGEAPPSSDDGFEATLGTISENPLGNPMFRRQSTGVLIRKTGNRRSGHRSVTFDESVKGAAPTDDENCSRRSLSPTHRQSKVLNVSADVHNQSDPLVAKMSSGRTTPVKNVNQAADDLLCVPNRRSRENIVVTNYNNASFDDAGSSTSDPMSDSVPVFNSDNNYEPPKEAVFSNPRVTSRSFSEAPKSDLKPSNLQQSEQSSANNARTRHSIGTEEELTNIPPKNVGRTNNFNNNNTKEFLRYSREGFIPRLGSKDCINKTGSQVYPRPLHIVLRKPEMGRRDSANFSLTSSQDTSSNDSDQGTALCSQNDPTKQ